MNFGLFMMPLHPPDRAFADAYDRDIDQIVLADRLGFREAWVGEHLTERWENAPAPDLLIAKALALTKNIRLGTGVTLLALHNPVYLAHRVAMLDHMARGRFQWGIGGGGIPTDLSLLGLDPATVRGRSAECWTSCSSSGLGRPFTYTAASSTSDARVRPRERARVLHEAYQRRTADRGGGQHPDLGSMKMAGNAASSPCRARCFPVSRHHGAWSRTARRRRAGRPHGASGASRETSSSRRPRRRRASAPAP